jgi:ankyrin repeat protein
MDMDWLEDDEDGDDDDIDMVEGVVDEPHNDANLPVAVPVHGILRHRRRQLVRMMRGRDRLRMHGPPFAQGVIEDDVPAWMEAEVAEVSSSFLMDLVREDLPCSAVLSGSNIRGCSTIVQRISENPEEVGYRCRRTNRTPLHEAALRCSCRHVIHAMMEVGTHRALQLDSRMNTPLHLLFMGISTRHIENEDMRQILDVLLEPYPPIGTMANGIGNLPIHCALAAPESMLPPGVIDRLIRASPTSVGRLNSWGQTALHLHCQRRNASVQLAEYLLNLAPESIQLRDRSVAHGFTPFHYAASNSSHALMALFARRDPLAAGIVSLNSGKTPLHVLCQQNPTTVEDAESIKRLLVASPNAATLTDQDASSTPLHLVCRGTRAIHFPIVEALVCAAPEALLIQDVNGYLPLHHALENGADSDVVRCLLDVEKRAAFLQTRKHDTALSLACTANKSVEAVKILLEANPAATLQPNDYGFLPIHCSCRAYQAQCMIVRELLRACPQAALKLTNGGESAMHLASNNSSASVAIIDMLSKTYQSLREENGTEEMHASPLRDKVLTSTVGNTPRKLFVRSYHRVWIVFAHHLEKTVHLACFRDFSRPHIESLAASNPSWISVRNNAGYSPLQILCKNGRIDE